MNSTALVLVFVGYLAYGALCPLALNLWKRRMRQRRPANLYADPDAWLTYWLPQFVVVEVWLLVGVGFLCSLLVIPGAVFQSGAGAKSVLGFVVCLAGLALGFVVLDASMVLNVRLVARQQADTHQDDHP